MDEDLKQVSARISADTVDWLDEKVRLYRAEHPGKRYTRSDALRETLEYAKAREVTGT